jgi:hypothetical protein
MRIKYSLIFSLFLFLSTAFIDNSSALAPAKAINPAKKSLASIAKGRSSSYSLILNPIESIPVLNLQVHKTVRCVQAIFCALNDFSVSLKCYNFFSGSGHKQFSGSQKVLLFPFHTFW